MPHSLAIAATTMLLFVSLGHAATITLEADGTGDYPTIQAAFDAASSGDTIVLNPGTYTDSNTRVILDWIGDISTTTAIAHMAAGVNITSSGGASVTFLDGELSHHGLVGVDLGTVDVAGITFVDCRPGGGSGGLATFTGSGLMIQRSSPLVRDNVFLRCEAGGGGGASGLYLIECSSPEVRGNLFEDNYAGDIGGGAGILQCTDALVWRNTFVNNVADDGGGAIEVNFSTMTFRNNVIAGNTGGNSAGGLLCLNGSQVTAECNVWWDNNDPIDGHWTFGCISDTDPNNTIADPAFCDPSSSDWTVRSNSPAAFSDASGCGQRGAFGVGCGPVSIESESWGSIKAHYR